MAESGFADAFVQNYTAITQAKQRQSEIELEKARQLADQVWKQHQIDPNSPENIAKLEEMRAHTKYYGALTADKSPEAQQAQADQEMARDKQKQDAALDQGKTLGRAKEFGDMLRNGSVQHIGDAAAAAGAAYGKPYTDQEMDALVKPFIDQAKAQQPSYQGSPAPQDAPPAAVGSQALGGLASMMAEGKMGPNIPTKSDVLGQETEGYQMAQRKEALAEKKRQDAVDYHEQQGNRQWFTAMANKDYQQARLDVMGENADTRQKLQQGLAAHQKIQDRVAVSKALTDASYKGRMATTAEKNANTRAAAQKDAKDRSSMRPYIIEMRQKAGAIRSMHDQQEKQADLLQQYSTDPRLSEEQRIGYSKSLQKLKASPDWQLIHGTPDTVSQADNGVGFKSVPGKAGLWDFYEKWIATTPGSENAPGDVSITTPGGIVKNAPVSVTTPGGAGPAKVTLPTITSKQGYDMISRGAHYIDARDGKEKIKR